MRSFLDDLSFVDDIDAMRRSNRTQPMRNDKDRTSLTDLRHVPLDHRFGFVVQRAQGCSDSNQASSQHTFLSSINEFQPFLFGS